MRVCSRWRMGRPIYVCWLRQISFGRQGPTGRGCCIILLRIPRIWRSGSQELLLCWMRRSLLPAFLMGTCGVERRMICGVWVTRLRSSLRSAETACPLRCTAGRWPRRTCCRGFLLIHTSEGCTVNWREDSGQQPGCRRCWSHSRTLPISLVCFLHCCRPLR